MCLGVCSVFMWCVRCVCVCVWCVCVYVHVCVCMYGVMCMHMCVVCVYTCVVCLGFIFLGTVWAYWVCGWMYSIIFKYSWLLALQTCFSASFSHFYFWNFRYTCVRIYTYQNIGTLLLHALGFKKCSFFSLCASAWIILIDLAQGSLISSLPVLSLLMSSWQEFDVLYVLLLAAAFPFDSFISFLSFCRTFPLSIYAVTLSH